MRILVSIFPHPPITQAPASVGELRTTRGGMWAIIESVLIVIVGSGSSRLIIIRSEGRGCRLGNEGKHVLHIELRLVYRSAVRNSGDYPSGWGRAERRTTDL